MSRQTRRPKMSRRLASVMMDELSTMGNRIIGDHFEGIKTKARFRFTKEELQDLCLCLSSAILCNNTVCRVTEIRGAKVIPFNHQERRMVAK